MGTRTVTLVMLVAIVTVVDAIDLDFPGFAHYKTWQGWFAGPSTRNPPLYRETPINYRFTYADQTVPSVAVRKDICSSDAHCVANGCRGACYFNTSAFQNSTYDTYLGIKGVDNSTHGSVCTVEDGGANKPDVKYLGCATDFNTGTEAGFRDMNLLNTYQLPPELIHRACMANPSCIGFRVKNDRSSGDLFRGRDNMGYLKFPMESDGFKPRG
jgi:hypothetical protein